MQLRREQLAVMGFLGGLGPKYETVISQILGGKTVASLTDTFARVFRVSCESSRDSTSVVDNLALVSSSRTGSGIRSDGGNHGGYNGRGGRGGGRSTRTGRSQGQPHLYGQPQPSIDNSGAARTCHYCGKQGHTQKFCYKLHGRPGQQQQFANTTSGADSFPRSSEGKVVVISEEEFARCNQSQSSEPTSSIATLEHTGFGYNKDDWQRT
ncbi:uncharacterized protein LOC125313881 [Rhodamnia argentea]|uniref:Uncharacterized protein LOC125313881 n=1 Tax=Rhodamnia argentea TaxID=178133 RepID=A0ABM3H2G2_9MYRT|nr:uncharacterized protein LOC125313881 [Rhodamnia argentea]